MEGQTQDTEAPPPPVAAQNSEDSANTTKTLRRACDCCRKRKVKCDGGYPCGPCTKATIPCAYLQPPKKKGPKGLRSARVLHALRKIDEHVARGPISPISADGSGAFGNWGWNQQNGAQPNGIPMQAQQQQDIVYGPHTSVPPEQTYYQQMPTSMPQPQPAVRPVIYTSDSSSTWSAHPESLAAEDMQNIMSPAGSDGSPSRIPGESFLPFMRLFFEHMFEIMPVIDRNIYLDPALYANSQMWSPGVYCFLCAICAATIVQLQVNSNMPELPPLNPNKSTDDLFADECLRERKTFDYIDNPSDLHVMTSFFLFAYSGNHEKHGKAWYYLQESIAFAENLDMDNEKSYLSLAPIEAQWRRRLYWLLFMTERAYAIQRRKHARLPASVTQPITFASEHPELLNGFNNLGKLFAAVDDNFVRAWRGSRKQSLCNEAWLAQTQEQIDKVALVLGDITETQHLDINITREWLHVLAWQMGVSNGLMWGDGDEGGMNLRYPVELARKVVAITDGANSLALDSHGIGMEQKLSDIAGCLADVLKCTAGDNSGVFLEGKHYLNVLLSRLSSIRGRESRYLKPLMQKMDGLMGYELGTETLPLPAGFAPNGNTSGAGLLHPSAAVAAAAATGAFYDAAANNGLSNGRLSPRWSIADSVGMLRTLSMSGNLGMPSLSGMGSAIPGAGGAGAGGGLGALEDWSQRRESGRVYDEAETEGLGGLEGWWVSGNPHGGAGGGVPQPV